MPDISFLLQPESWIALLTLTAMEIVLGIDNIVFISILTAKLPPDRQAFARRLGLFLAMFMRVALLLAINWVMGLTAPLFTVLAHEISGRDLILGVGGLFLVGKATHEIYENVEGPHKTGDEGAPKPKSVASVITQITILDLVFSLDSVITAVGMAKHIAIMIIAVVVSIGVMLLFAGAIGDFINAHPSMKVLALSFLILIGVMLLAEALGQHIDKGYIYVSMAFALGVELINMRIRGRRRQTAATA